jgi:hypothetical protein
VASQSCKSLASTQITLSTGRVSCQATIVRREDACATLTVVTAAHALFPRDHGQSITVTASDPETRLDGEVLSVRHNANFKPMPSRNPDDPVPFRGAVGSDIAVVIIRLRIEDDDHRRAFCGFQPARIAARPIPSRAGFSILTVHIIDRVGALHTVRAGNPMNPKRLEWGLRYMPRPGDSGSGVFVFLVDREGNSFPVLIGTLSSRDDRGGIASLFFTDELRLSDGDRSPR